MEAHETTELIEHGHEKSKHEIKSIEPDHVASNLEAPLDNSGHHRHDEEFGNVNIDENYNNDYFDDDGDDVLYEGDVGGNGYSSSTLF